MTRVKICGIQETSHALSALDSGADMLGFVFASSRRMVSPDRAKQILSECRLAFPDRKWDAVGVFANQPLGFVNDVASFCDLNVVQLSGDEPPDYCARIGGRVFKALHLGPRPLETLGCNPVGLEPALRQLARSHKAARLLLDTASTGQWGGTGRTFDWKAMGFAASDCIVAGGLATRNVAEAISALHPWAVDVSSGVEVDGRKDEWLMRRFISEVRRCDSGADQTHRA